MTYDQWVDTYKPIPNPHVKPDERPFNNCMFETFGPELGQALSAADNCIWTIVEADGEWWLTHGYHVVSRMGYLISEVPFDLSNPPDDISLEDD